MNYLPYQISYLSDGKQINIPARHAKRALADARPLVKKGEKVVASKWDEEDNLYYEDEELQKAIDMLPKPEVKGLAVKKGSLSAYAALETLSAMTARLSQVARKRVLTDQEKGEIIAAMENVDQELLLTGPRAFPEEVEA